MVWVTLIELDNKNKCFYNYYSKAREGWKDVQCREIHQPRQITRASLLSRVCVWMGYDISGAQLKRKHTHQLMVVVTSLVPLPFQNPAWTSGSSSFMYCWSLAWRILSITLLACEMSAIVRQFEHSLDLPFFGIGMKTDLSQSRDHCCVFQICWPIECSTFTASNFRIWNSSTGIPSPPLALFIVMLPKAHLTSHSRTSGSRWVITPLCALTIKTSKVL